MTLEFQGNDRLTIGVEIELQILDPETLDLIPQSEKLLTLCKEKGLDRVKMEIHQSMLEVDSEISSDIKECRLFLESRLIQLCDVAESANLMIGATGTHPFQFWKDRLISRNGRYEYLHEKFQWLARRMNVYGLHVHVGMPSGDRALAVSQAMIQYLPHLLALSANSPFWQGIDTGMQSSRVNIMESFPFAGIPPHFKEWKEFEYYHETLVQAGAIQSLKDLYWYVRPNLTFGTIEFRICDAMTTLSETMAVVALIHCLVARISKLLDENRNAYLGAPEVHWIAPHNQWVAARDGLDGSIIVGHGKKEKISNAVAELVEELAPFARRLNCLEELNCITSILSQGNGAQRQRGSLVNFGSMSQIALIAAKEFRKDLQRACNPSNH